MKQILVLFFLIISSFGWGQDQFDFTISGQLINATKGDTVYFLHNNGKNNVLIAAIPVNKKGAFEQKMSLIQKDYYILSTDKKQRINVIVEGTGKVHLTADAKNLFYSVAFQENKDNSNLINFLRIASKYKVKLDSANTYLKSHIKEKVQIQRSFQPIYQGFLKQRSDFIKENQKSPALIAVLSTLNLKEEFDVYKNVVDNLNARFGESPTIQRIVSQYNANYDKMQSSLPIPIGSAAKDIALPSPQGDTLQLSDLKGKVVLLDFWASWCRPCRQENPNVVKAYNRFKDKGFTVYSVSLDKNAGRWKQAIQQDGLVWPTHVSDLKGWTSSAAQLYNVHSIPHSFLIDREGNIIANNLRGEALQNKLETIFGE